MIKRYIIIVLMALSFSAISHFLDSEYILNDFPDTAIVLACALLAIFLSSICTLFSQLDMLRNKYKVKFERTIRNIKFALVEFIASMSLIILLKIIISSQLFKCTLKEINYIPEIFSFLLLLFAIDIVSIIYDSTISVINAFEFRTNND